MPLLRLARPSLAFSHSHVRALAAVSGVEKPFNKVLIANRGEIACRVIRTCKRLGIKTVAVYSDPDSRSMHVRMADEAVRIGPAQSLKSYLSVDAVMDALKKTGAQAVHPGYGFLSEKKIFCEAVANAGAKFIGPGIEAITLMGDKITSKQIARKAGVSVVPGVTDLVLDDVQAIKISHQIGYPVMIKASGGGGGKGMRIAWNDDDVRIGYRLSRDEAKSSFNDDRIFIEKYIEEPHHIEIQILADSFRNVAAFPERECSIQRRNQKVFEESPSCHLDQATREAMGQQAASLAKTVGYESAGTCEFLVDAKRNFFFLEMNTRLQVEHPVTEMITGEDLVEHQLWIAAGKPLPDRLIKHKSVPFKGWAMESRLYAEDPFKGFLPSTGPLMTYIEPPIIVSPEHAHVRIDTGVNEGAEISMWYDPMICKLITWGKDRTEVLKYMNNALDSYVVKGLGHNLAFLRDVCRNPRYVSGHYTTKFIPEQYPTGFHGVKLTDAELSHAFAASAFIELERRLKNGRAIHGKVNAPHTYVVTINGESRVARVEHSGHFSAETKSEAVKVFVRPQGDANAHEDLVTINQWSWRIEQPIIRATINGDEHIIQYHGHDFVGYQLMMAGAYLNPRVLSTREFELSKHMLPPEVRDVSNLLICPMPGALVSIAVTEGQHIELGQELCVVEAMKMQNVLRSERKGKVSKIFKKVGQSLKVEETIMEFLPEDVTPANTV